MGDPTGNGCLILSFSFSGNAALSLIGFSSRAFSYSNDVSRLASDPSMLGVCAFAERSAAAEHQRTLVRAAGLEPALSERNGF